jgi:hypothetical protein
VEGLSDRLSFLTIVVPSQLAKQPGLKVTRDGVELPPGQFGAAVPVDGGTYRVEASLPEQGAWSATVTVKAERDKQVLVIELSPPKDPKAQVSPRSASTGSTAAPAPDTPRRHRTLEYASLGTGIAGVLGIGLGIGFGISAGSKNSASEEHCDARGCDAQGFEQRNDAIHAATISTWSFVVGGVLAATSVALYIGSRSDDGRSATRVDITTRRDLAAISVTEAF